MLPFQEIHFSVAGEHWQVSVLPSSTFACVSCKNYSRLTSEIFQYTQGAAFRYLHPVTSC